MQTLSEVIRFISSNKLEIDTTNLQEDFDAEKRAAAKPSDLLSTSPAPIASPRKPDEMAVNALRDMSWEIPDLKNDMRFPFRLCYSVEELGKHEYDVNAQTENQNLLL